MDVLKLSMGDRSLCNSRKLIVIAEGTKIGQEIHYSIRRWRHVIGVTRAVVAASKPVLLVSNHTTLGSGPRSRHEPAMHVKDVCWLDRSLGVSELDCPSHGINVSKNFFSGNVAWRFAEFASYLCVEKSATADLKAFDL